MFLHGIVSAQLPHSPRFKSAQIVFTRGSLIYITLIQNDLGHFLSIIPSKQVGIGLPARPLSGRGQASPAQRSVGRGAPCPACRPETWLCDDVVSFVAVLNFIALSIKWEKDLYITDIFSLNKQSPLPLLNFLPKYINHSRVAVSVLVHSSSCMCHEVFCIWLG